MPRPSPFNIVLTRDEQNQLETRARKYTSPYRDVIRAKIVLLAAQGLSNDVIAARLDTPRQIVSKWRKRFALARLPGLEEQPRGGRPALSSSLSVVVQVKAACELPHRLGLPLSRLSLADIRQEVIAPGMVAQVCGTRLWGWLSADAICPWQQPLTGADVIGRLKLDSSISRMVQQIYRHKSIKHEPQPMQLDCFAESER